MHHEITKVIPLLDEKGNLKEPGYAKKLLPIYDRTKVKGGFARLKEGNQIFLGSNILGSTFGVSPNSFRV